MIFVVVAQPDSQASKISVVVDLHHAEVLRKTKSVEAVSAGLG